MVLERGENELDREGAAGDDALTAAINSLVAIVCERIPTSSAEHKAVMTAVIDIHRQLRERGGARRLN
jgi:hypothetical protein